MTRVAAIDCGTNSLRLLIADLDPVQGTETELVREMRVVRLGEGVDRTGVISADAMTRVFAALEDYMVEVRRLQARRVRFCATSAARDATNAVEFMAGVRDRVGSEPEVLSGSEEAEATYLGATRNLPSMPSPALVVDIGGGSTELVLGSAAASVSLDIGSVRLTERHFHDDPPTRSQAEAVRADIDEALDGCGLDLASAASVVGVGGTATTVAAAALDLPAYDRAVIHRSSLTMEAVQRTARELLALTVQERRALPYMHPGRADVIAAGALILDRVLRRTPVPSLLVSEHDILDGIAWSTVSGDGGDAIDRLDRTEGNHHVR